MEKLHLHIEREKEEKSKSANKFRILQQKTPHRENSFTYENSFLTPFECGMNTRCFFDSMREELLYIVQYKFVAPASAADCRTSSMGLVKPTSVRRS